MDSRHARQWTYAAFCVAFAFCPVGCRSPLVGGSLPHQYQVRWDDVRLKSELPVDKTTPLAQELRDLRQEIVQTLDLPTQHRPVTVYLFANETAYAKYLKANHPTLPPRRAYFIGTRTELAVYAFWGEQVREDLRHEYTHGLLHGCLKNVPLWLDEGLAEYFETDAPGHLHPEHSVRLASAVEHGWRPDLPRLEQIEEVGEMQRADYQESWCWVHWLLQQPAGKQQLLEYLAELKTNEKPAPLSQRIKQHLPHAAKALVEHAAFTQPMKGTNEIRSREF